MRDCSTIEVTIRYKERSTEKNPHGDSTELLSLVFASGEMTSKELALFVKMVSEASFGAAQDVEIERDVKAEL